MWVRLYYQIAVVMLTGPAVLINLTLLPIILMYSGPGIGTYKYVLLSYVMVAAIYASITFVTLPIFLPNKGGWLLFATADYFPPEIARWFFVIFGGCYVKLLLILTISFLYRYIVLCRDKSIAWLHEPKRMMLVLFVFLFVTIGLGYIVIATVASPSPEKTKIFESFVYDAVNINLSEVGYTAFPVGTHDSINYTKSSAWALSFWGLLITVCTSIMIFCIVKIITEFRKTTSLMATTSIQNRQLQRKLFILLILQTLVPVLCCFVPTLFSYVTAFLDAYTPRLSMFYSVLLPFSQLLDPLLIYFLISDYRTAIRRFIPCVKDRQETFALSSMAITASSFAA